MLLIGGYLRMITNQDILFSSENCWEWGENENEYFYKTNITSSKIVKLSRMREIDSDWKAELVYKESVVVLPIETQTDVNLLVKDVDRYIGSYLRI